MTAFVQEFFLGVRVYCYAYFAVVFMTKYQTLLLEGKCLLHPPPPQPFLCRRKPEVHTFCIIQAFG